MNIALFPSAFHPSLGGVEELTRQLALELQRQGHRTMIFTERWPRYLPAAENFEGLEIRRHPMRVPADSFKSRVSFALTHRKIRSAIVKQLRQFRADVLHVQCVSSTTLYALHAKRTLGVPLVVTLQGELTMDSSGIFDRPGIAQTILGRALKQADRITACSRHTLAEAEQFFGEEFGQRGNVIHNGVRVDELREAKPFRHNRPYVLAIGRHVKQKGFDVLLRAWAEAGDLGIDLILAGDGQERNNLEKLADELNVKSRVVFAGRKGRDETAALFKGCEFFVLPSRHEPFGIVNLEAMAAAKAVLATRVGGVPEVVEDGATGLLVPAEDVAALAAGIRKLCCDPALRQRMGHAAAERVSIFDWRAVAEKYLILYQGLLPQTATGCEQSAMCARQAVEAEVAQPTAS